MDKQIQLSTGLCSYYDSGGNKSPLMIIHGFSLKIGYTPYVNYLKDNFRLIIPDLPFATAYDFFKKHTVDNYTDFLIELTEKLKLKNLNIYGNSLGGSLGLSYALKNSKGITKLVVRSPFYSKNLLPFKFRNLISLSICKTLAYNRVTLNPFANIFFGKMANYSVNTNTDKSLYDEIKKAQKKLDKAKCRDIIFDLLSINFGSRLSNIENEVLILWPDSDKLLNPKMAKSLHCELKNSRLFIEPNAHHCIATVDPKVLTGHISDFIK
jgi:2-hydroxy-6-oxonona-2,4-dienedioate hydrolase